MDTRNVDKMPLRYAIESFWMDAWWTKFNAATPERALELYYQVQRSNERAIEMDNRNGITTPESSAYRSALRIRRDDGVIMVEAKQAVSTVSVSLATDSAELETLRKQVEKLTADNAAFQAILLQAAQDFSALKAENARYKTGLSRLVKTMDAMLDLEDCDWDDYSNARNQANDILVVVEHAATLPTPSTPQGEAE